MDIYAIHLRSFIIGESLIDEIRELRISPSHIFLTIKKTISFVSVVKEVLFILFQPNQRMVIQNHSIVSCLFLLFKSSNFLNHSFVFYLANSIRFETEQEEKRLLQEQLHQLEISSNETNAKLSKQIEIVKNLFF